MRPAAAEKVVFETKWFRVIEKYCSGVEPHYLIQTNDFVSIIALDADGKLLLVRQFRPTVGRETLEVPSGHVESGETPEEAARKELLEETGYRAETWELLGTVSPSIGRYTNQLWCYFAQDARPAGENVQVEAGIDFVLNEWALQELLAKEEFCSSLSYTSLLMAIAKGRLPLSLSDRSK